MMGYFSQFLYSSKSILELKFATSLHQIKLHIEKDE